MIKIRPPIFNQMVMLAILFAFATGLPGCSKRAESNATGNGPNQTETGSVSAHSAAGEKVSSGIKFTKFSLDNVSGDRVEMTFTEVSVAEIYAAIVKHLDLKKGEFETSDDFRARVDNAISTPYFHTLKLDDPVAFIVEIAPRTKFTYIKYKYDADNGLLSVYVDSTYAPMGFSSAGELALRETPPSKLAILKIAERRSILATGTGQNLFGAQREIELTKAEFYGLASKSIPFLSYGDNPYGNHLNETTLVELKVEAKHAQEIAGDLSALVVFQPRNPYVIEKSEASAPTMSTGTGQLSIYKFLFGDLQGVIIYRKSSGEIIARLPENTKRR